MCLLTPLMASGAILAFMFSAGEARAQVLNAVQQKCVVELNRAIGKVAKAQGKDTFNCIRAGRKGKLGGTLEGCLVADRKGKVARAKSLLAKRIDARCTDPLPDFGIPLEGIDTDALGADAVDAQLALIHALFGSNLDVGILPARDPNDASVRHTSKCQLSAAKETLKCFDAMWRDVFFKCKKKVFSLDEIVSAEYLEDVCVRRSTPRACGARLYFESRKFCRAPADGLRALPGYTGFDPNFGTVEDQLASFELKSVFCEFCKLANQVDGLNEDCDLFDGLPSGSCP